MRISGVLNRIGHRRSQGGFTTGLCLRYLILNSFPARFRVTNWRQTRDESVALRAPQYRAIGFKFLVYADVHSPSFKMCVIPLTGRRIVDMIATLMT